jgi:predicted acylesterase/phospholipase RssA
MSRLSSSFGIGPRKELGFDELPVWLAARAAIATVDTFPPVEVLGSKLMDGGLRANCPLNLAIPEAGALFRRDASPYEQRLVVVSVGTGFSMDPTVKSFVSFGEVSTDVLRSSKDTVQQACLWLSARPGAFVLRLDPGDIDSGTNLANYSLAARESRTGQISRWLQDPQMQLQLRRLSEALGSSSSS